VPARACSTLEHELGAGNARKPQLGDRTHHCGKTGKASFRVFRLHSFHRFFLPWRSACGVLAAHGQAAAPPRKHLDRAVPPPLCRRRAGEAPAGGSACRAGDHGTLRRLHRQLPQERSSRTQPSITTADGSVVTTTTVRPAGAYSHRRPRAGQLTSCRPPRGYAPFQSRPFRGAGQPSALTFRWLSKRNNRA